MICEIYKLTASPLSRWATEDYRKLLLTATLLQNSLIELYGLSTLIDEQKNEMQKRHILFQEEDRESYVRSMLEMVGAGGAAR